MSTNVQSKPRSVGSIVWLAVLVVLLILGFAQWGRQLTQGMSLTGISQQVVWGFYIGSFFILAGTASGLLFFAGLSSLAAHRRSFLIASLAGYIAAGIVILMDIGHPERVLQFLTSPQASSPFVWDFYALGLAVLVGVVYLFFSPKWMSWIAGAAALVVVVAEGLLLAVTGARPLWSSPLTPAIFIVEAAITASAVAILIVGDEKVRRMLVTILRIGLPVLLGLLFAEIATEVYGGEIEAKEAVGLLLSGPLATLFWLQVIGFAVAFVLTMISNVNLVLVSLAAIVAVLSTWLAKMSLLVAGQTYGFNLGPVSYAPTLVELGSVVGVLALAILVYVIGRRLIPAER